MRATKMSTSNFDRSLKSSRVIATVVKITRILGVKYLRLFRFLRQVFPECPKIFCVNGFWGIIKSALIFKS